MMTSVFRNVTQGGSHVFMTVMTGSDGAMKRRQRRARWRAVCALASGGACACVCASGARAQDTVSAASAQIGGLPRDVSREISELYNNPSTKRVRGPYTLAAGDTVRGDVAVLDGPARIAGVITGQFVAINADVAIDSSARIAGGITVVGGELNGPVRTELMAKVRLWRSRLRYAEIGGRIVPTDEGLEVARWQRWRHWPGNNDVQGAWGDLFLASGHTYNRVEGLPLIVGPRLRTRHGETRITAEAFGIFRTGDRLSWEPANLGHKVRAELRQGEAYGYTLGGRLYDEIAPVENWSLTDAEVGLGSALFTRDYRDYYQHHGGSGYASVFGPGLSSLSVSLARERWGSRNARDPWSIINNGDPWRINPKADAGLMHLVTINGHLDTRNNTNRPTSGWFLDANYERGTGELIRVAPTTLATRPTVPGNITYARAFVDLRRYNRVAPNTQLNLRLVAGGVLAGDPLPAQRRLSVSGADALPGYDFRSKTGDIDVGTCSSGSDAEYTALGRPAQCDRMILVQGEWKSDFHVSLFGDNDARGRSWFFGHGLRAEGMWVIFMDSGRGWLVGAGDDELHFDKTALPMLRTWRTDVGAGLDFGSFGVYVAQAVSNTELKANVFIRLGRRF